MWQAFVLVAALGQCPSCDSGYTTNFYYGPAVCSTACKVTEYWTNGEPHRTRYNAKLFYGPTLQEVPVINGWVPTVTVRNNGNYVIYDYRNKIPYDKCAAYTQVRLEQVNQKTASQLQAPKKELIEPEKTKTPVKQNPVSPLKAPKKELVEPEKTKTPTPSTTNDVGSVVEAKPVPQLAPKKELTPRKVQVVPEGKSQDNQKDINVPTLAEPHKSQNNTPKPKAPTNEASISDTPINTSSIDANSSPQRTEKKPSEVGNAVRVISPSYKD